MLQNYKKERQAPFLVYPPHCKYTNYFLYNNYFTSSVFGWHTKNPLYLTTYRPN